MSDTIIISLFTLIIYLIVFCVISIIINKNNRNKLKRINELAIIHLKEMEDYCSLEYYTLANEIKELSDITN